MMKYEATERRMTIASAGLVALTVAAICAEHAWAKDGQSGGYELGRIASNQLDEVSGIAASRQNPNILWMHNDGDADRLYAVHTSGQVVARVLLPVKITDLEDIAIGPGPEHGVDYLYLGDIGGNDEDRGKVRVFRFPEPKFRSGHSIEMTAGKMERLRLTYPRDKSYDAETILVDPATGDVYIVTKESKRARVFVARADRWKENGQTMLEPLGKLDLKYISGGDISRDGSHILLRRESRGWLWSRGEGESISAALAKPPRQVPVRLEDQSLNGEAIAFEPDGSAYYTVSEGQREPIGQFRIRPKSGD